MPQKRKFNLGNPHVHGNGRGSRRLLQVHESHRYLLQFVVGSWRSTIARDGMGCQQRAGAQHSWAYF